MAEPEKPVEDPTVLPDVQPVDAQPTEASPTDAPPPAATETALPVAAVAVPADVTNAAEPTDGAVLPAPTETTFGASKVQEPVTGGDAANNGSTDGPPPNSQVATGEVPLPEPTDAPPMLAETTPETTTNPDNIEIRENEVNVEDDKSAVDFLLGDGQKQNAKDSPASNAEQHPGPEGGNLDSARSVTSEVLTEVDYSVQTALADADETGEPEGTAILEKQPAIGQLQLKELLSGTSIKIVEHAQKLAEAPLIGTIVPPQDLPPESTTVPQTEPNQILPSSRSSRTAPGTRVEEKPTGETRAPEGEGEDRFPGPDYEDGSRSIAPPSDFHPLLLQDPEVQSDMEPYEIYTIPEGADKEDEVPAILKRYIKSYQDDKEPVAKMFKMEDEDKLNEAVCW
ncbi:hypothetical protein RvY_09985-1 [Ramazzottius varieornatus]|uniref:Uncharacterized protein n=1 Tax=Ramazzottius varieornatus TaxID=947166 RepID=A0A1D1VK86_RAMVA|nr:hypothetical protein RvY_09985-1 [Ramazzottius varieornatus]